MQRASSQFHGNRVRRAISLVTAGATRLRVNKSFKSRNRAAAHVAIGNRQGTILVVTAIVLIALVGLLGLVVDAGQLMTAHREIQNAADAAATSAAMDVLSGSSNSTAIATGTTFVKDYNKKGNATVVINIPPLSGPYLGNSHYAEAIVSNTVTTRFIQVVGFGASQTVKARAVAGWEGTAVAAGVIALDKAARPGLSIVGNGSLKVNGTVLINSNGGGLSQNGVSINNGQTGTAITTSVSGKLYARDVESVGGVNSVAGVKNFDTSNPTSPLHTGTISQPDPFIQLGVPTTANGAVATNYGAIRLTSLTNVTLSPGVYTSINLSSNANVTLNPGIYVIQGGGLTMTGNSTLTGSNVMLYNTGSDYNVTTGLPDSGDGSSSPPASGNPTFGAVSITGNALINLTPYVNSSSPFDGMVYYQRRLNTQPFTLAGNGVSDVMKGTVYAKWGALNLTGNGTFNSQFVVQSLVFAGNGSLALDVTGQHLAQSDQVFLVE